MNQVILFLTALCVSLSSATTSRASEGISTMHEGIEEWEGFAAEQWDDSSRFSPERWDLRFSTELEDVLGRFEPVRLKATGKRVYSEGTSFTVLEFDAEFSGLKPRFRGVVDQLRLDEEAVCPTGAVRAHRLRMNLETSDRVISRNFTRLEAIVCLIRVEGPSNGRWVLQPRVTAMRSRDYSPVLGPTIRGLLRDQVPALIAALVVIWK